MMKIVIIYFAVVILFVSCNDQNGTVKLMKLDLVHTPNALAEYISFKNEGEVDTIYKLTYRMDNGLSLYNDSLGLSNSINASIRVDSTSTIKNVKLRFTISDRNKFNITDGEYLLMFYRNTLISSDFFYAQRIQQLLASFKVKYKDQKLDYFGWETFGDSLVLYHSLAD